jgi:hypothetical protein
MIWRNVKSKGKISMSNLIALKVLDMIASRLEELAECQNKRDEFNKQAQDLRAQLGRSQSTSYAHYCTRGISGMHN